MSYLPPMNQTCKRTTGAAGIPPNSVIFTGQPCGFWLSRARQEQRVIQGEPLIWGQVALPLSLGWQTLAWRGNPLAFNPAAADLLQITTPGGPTFSVIAVSGAPMWAGTEDQHFRVNVSTAWSTNPILPISFFTGRTDGITVVISITRPFNGAVIATGVAAVRYADLPAGRGSYSGGNYHPWTDFFDVASSKTFEMAYQGQLASTLLPGVTVIE